MKWQSDTTVRQHEVTTILKIENFLRIILMTVLNKNSVKPNTAKPKNPTSAPRSRAVFFRSSCLRQHTDVANSYKGRKEKGRLGQRHAEKERRENRKLKDKGSVQFRTSAWSLDLQRESFLWMWKTTGKVHFCKMRRKRGAASHKKWQTSSSESESRAASTRLNRSLTAPSSPAPI